MQQKTQQDSIATGYTHVTSASRFLLRWRTAHSCELSLFVPVRSRKEQRRSKFGCVSLVGSNEQRNLEHLIQADDDDSADARVQIR